MAAKAFKASVYEIGSTYRFSMVSGGTEPAVYLGKNAQGMHRFQLPGGQLWTGYSAPVTRE